MTPEQIELARNLRDNESLCYDLIAERLGVTRDTVRRALCPTFRERRNEAARKHRLRKSLQTDGVDMSGSASTSSREMNPVYDPIRDGQREYRSLGYWLMGDPPIGRSALDQRGGS